jgi:hypothetical protein
MSSVLSGHSCIAEPELAFHPERSQDRSPHPLRGLLEFGPYSRSLLSTIADPIRVATLSPHGEAARMRNFVAEFERGHSPRERKSYLPEWPGFSKVFGLGLVPADAAGTHMELPADLDDRIATSAKPHTLLAGAIGQALRHFTGESTDYEIVMIMLPDRWEAGFGGPEDESFDLHDFIKAHLAIKRLPSQIIRESRALSYHCRASVSWRLGIALYCKAGGVPWKLADSDPEVAFIGLSYALGPKTQNGQRFLTCCSQVFDADGAGLEFIAYDAAESEYKFFGENPFLSREEMRRVMARSLALYQHRHAGCSPRHVFVHKTTEFKPREVEGVFDALGQIAAVDLLQIKDDTAWKALRIDPPKAGGPKGQAAGYPLERGTVLPLSGTEALLWTAGDAPQVAQGSKHYFKEGKGIPDPIMMVRHAGHGGWEASADSVLALTKMNWNNDALYDRMPVTLRFASDLARTVATMDSLGPSPYPVRFFI